jgi:hypothetical protein
MVYEHLLICFILEDPSSGLFHVITTIARGDIPRSVALVLWVIKLLVMAKDIGGLHPIVVGKMFL